MPASRAERVDHDRCTRARASRAPRTPRVVVGADRLLRHEDRDRCPCPRRAASRSRPVIVVALEDRPLHRRGASPPRQQREVQVHRAHRWQAEDLGREELAVGDDDQRIGSGSPRSPSAPAPSRTPSTSSSVEPEPPAASATARGRDREPRPAGRGGFVITRSTSTSSAFASALRVGTDQGSLPRKTTRAVVPADLSQRCPPRRQDPRVPARCVGARPAPIAALVVEAVDVQRAFQVVGLVLEDAGEQPLPGELEGRTLDVLAAARSVAYRVVSWYGPGIDRHPSSSTGLALAADELGFAMNSGPVSPSSNTNRRRRCPPAVRRARPRARRTSSRPCRLGGSAQARSKGVTGLAGSRRTGSPRVRIGMITGSSLPFGSQMRLGLDTGDHVAHGEGTGLSAERRDAARVEREQAYRLPLGRRDQQRDRFEGRELVGQLRVADHPGTRRIPPGTPPALAARARPDGSAPGRPARATGSRGRSPCADCTIARPPGLAHAIASVQVVTARSRAVSPGRRPARSASRIATRSSPLASEVADIVGAADEDLAVGRQARRVVGRQPVHGDARDRAAHSSTRSCPPRRRPKSLAPQARHRPGASQTTHRTAPSLDRSTPRQTAQAAGWPHARQTAAMPYPGSGEKRNALVLSRSARTSRGARPSGPGDTISTGTQLRRRGATVGSAKAAASDEGAIADMTTTARSISPARKGHVAHVVVRRPILAQGGVRFAPHHDQPEIGHRGEDARARADDDVISTGLRVEPGAVPRPLRTPQETRHSVVAERRGRSPSPCRGRAPLPARSRAPAFRCRGTARRPRPRRRSRARARAGAPTPPARPPRSPPRASAPPGTPRGLAVAAQRERPGATRPARGSPRPRPAAASPARARRPGAPRTARSPTGTEDSPASSNHRVGDTTFFTSSTLFGTSSVEPSTHPRTTRPWNGTCTRDPTPASSSAGRS